MLGFHRDFDLIYIYLSALLCPLVLDVNVLSELIPDLEVLNLNGNKFDIDLIQLMVKLILFKLKLFNIGNNSIRDIEEVNPFKDLELEKLILTGNLICYEYQSTNDYIHDVPKRCPDLLRLDGMDLQKPVLCDILDEGNDMTVVEKLFTANE